MDKSKIIVWEKWRDPLGYDDIEDKALDIEQIYDSEEENNTYDYNHINDKKVVIKNINEKFILTPLGLIPLTENTASSKIFNFWTGHTTFTISKKISSIIENIQGVETLDIFTRYRFRISVGKAFDDSIVLREINNSIYNYLIEKKYDT